MAPGFDGRSGLSEAHEDMLVEAFVAQAAVERFHECILHELARRDVVPVEPPKRPAQQRGTGHRVADAHQFHLLSTLMIARQMCDQYSRARLNSYRPQLDKCRQFAAIPAK